jgi:outer membrane protein TolC
LTAQRSVALALRNSLEKSLFDREEAIRKELATRAWYKLLPTMKGSFDRDQRNVVRASNSVGFESKKESLATNFSAERGSRSHGISVLWNALDFGLSYYGAKQAEKKVQIAAYDYQRVRQNLALSAVQAWWRCAILEKSAAEAVELEALIQDQIKVLDKFLADSSIQRDRGLASQKQLLELLQKLQGFSREAAAARAELARVLGLKTKDFELAAFQAPPLTDYARFDVQALEQEALRNRPELLTEEPSPASMLDHKWDANPHLYANYWYTITQRIAMDFFRLPEKFKALKAAKMEAEMVKYRRMAMAVGILSQLHLALIEYHAAANQTLSTTEIDKVQEELMGVTAKMVKAGSLGKESLLTSRIYRFLAAVQHRQTYADMQIRISQIRNVIGRKTDNTQNPLPFIEMNKGRFDPLDIENLPTLALVAESLAYTKYDVKQRAKRRLMQSGEEGAAAALDVLNSVDERARVMATIIVREKGSARVVASLIPALSDENPDVRYQAALALREAFGQRFGYFHKGREKDRQIAIQQWEDYLFSGEPKS